jgi:type II secretory pathway pseudopilin PulG
MTAVAVLAILTAIALPSLSAMMGGADERRIARIAQEFAQAANSALAAGSDDFASASSVAEVIEILSAGVEGRGVFAGTEFRVPGVAPEVRIRAAAHLSLDQGTLVYSSKV